MCSMIVGLAECGKRKNHRVTPGLGGFGPVRTVVSGGVEGTSALVPLGRRAKARAFALGGSAWAAPRTPGHAGPIR